MWNPRHSMSFTSTKGLLNGPGENNCFLNSAVQVFWHLDVFRRSFRKLSGHACMGNSCIFCALKVIFTQFQYSDQSALPPDALRKALSKAFADKQKFQLGCMDDAAEVFENILMRIHFHIANKESEDMCNAPHCLPHQKFAMTVVEQIVCKCGATSEPLPFTQMVHYVTTSSLVREGKAATNGGTEAMPTGIFGQLLRNAGDDGNIRDCPSQCGEKVRIRRSLMNCPDVVSIGLVWDSDRPGPENIMDVVKSVGTSLRLPDLFHSVVDDRWSNSSSLYLVGVVCYYGKHYSTFFFHTKLQVWVYFDDATVREIGPSWSKVVDKCIKGRYQPLLLLYANPNGAPIPTDTAPQTKTLVPDHQRFNSDDGGSNSGGVPEKYSPYRSPRDDSTLTKGGYDYDTKTMKRRRAITPNPDSWSHREEVIPRRAITPGPEMHGVYDSDEEGSGKKLVANHPRQPSYVLAIEEDGAIRPEDAYSHATATFNSMDYDYRDHLDRKTPQPMLNGQPEMNNHKPMYNGYHDNPPAPPAAGSDYVYATSNRDQYRRLSASSDGPQQGQAGMAPPIQPDMSHRVKEANLAKVNEIQHRESFKKGKYNKVGADVVRYQYSGSSGPVNAGQAEQVYSAYERPDVVNGVPENAPTTLTRTKSLENNSMMTTQAPSSSGHMVRKPRPSSAQTYNNYKGAREHRERKYSEGALIDHPGYADVVDAGVHRNGHYGNVHSNGNQVNNNYDNSNHSNNYMRTGLPQPSKVNETTNQVWNQNLINDNQSDYISRKAVESIMNYQKTQRKGLNGSIHSSSSTSSLESYNEVILREKVAPAIKEALKVDIPDNTSIGSRRDSGYRSSSSSGDRFSNSSTSGGSVESPVIDSLTGYAYRAQFSYHRQEQLHRQAMAQYGNQLNVPPSNGFDRSSTESLSSTHSNNSNNLPPATEANGGQVQNNRLSRIPENIATTQNKQRQQALPKEKLSPVEAASVNHGTKVQVLNTLPTSPPEKDLIDFSGAEDQCEVLCCKAEDELDRSLEQEAQGDQHMALIHCNKAISYLKQAMELKGCSQKSFVYAQMKHNTCVMRCRSLHRRIMHRQDSSQSGTPSNSDVGSEDHMSLSSMSTDPGSNDLMHFEDSPKNETHLLQERLKDLYLQGGPSANQGAPPQNQSKPVVNMYGAAPSQYGGGQQSGMDSRQHGGHAPSTPFKVKHKRAPPKSHSADDMKSFLDTSDRPGHGVELYATLPKKRSPKRNKTPASELQDAQVYESYLQRQKDMQKTVGQISSHGSSHHQLQQQQQQGMQHNWQSGQNPQHNRQPHNQQAQPTAQSAYHRTLPSQAYCHQQPINQHSYQQQAPPTSHSQHQAPPSSQSYHQAPPTQQSAYQEAMSRPAMPPAYNKVTKSMSKEDIRKMLYTNMVQKQQPPNQPMVAPPTQQVAPPMQQQVVPPNTHAGSHYDYQHNYQRQAESSNTVHQQRNVQHQQHPQGQPPRSNPGGLDVAGQQRAQPSVVPDAAPSQRTSSSQATAQSLRGRSGSQEAPEQRNRQLHEPGQRRGSRHRESSVPRSLPSHELGQRHSDENQRTQHPQAAAAAAQGPTSRPGEGVAGPRNQQQGLRTAVSSHELAKPETQAQMLKKSQTPQLPRKSGGPTPAPPRRHSSLSSASIKQAEYEHIMKQPPKQADEQQQWQQAMPPQQQQHSQYPKEPLSHYDYLQKYNREVENHSQPSQSHQGVGYHGYPGTHHQGGAVYQPGTGHHSRDSSCSTLTGSNPQLYPSSQSDHSRQNSATSNNTLTPQHSRENSTIGNRFVGGASQTAVAYRSSTGNQVSVAKTRALSTSALPSSTQRSAAGISHSREGSRSDTPPLPPPPPELLQPPSYMERLKQLEDQGRLPHHHHQPISWQQQQSSNQSAVPHHDKASTPLLPPSSQPNTHHRPPPLAGQQQQQQPQEQPHAGSWQSSHNEEEFPPPPPEAYVQSEMQHGELTNQHPAYRGISANHQPSISVSSNQHPPSQNGIPLDHTKQSDLTIEKAGQALSSSLENADLTTGQNDDRVGVRDLRKRFEQTIAGNEPSSQSNVKNPEKDNSPTTEDSNNQKESANFRTYPRTRNKSPKAIKRKSSLVGKKDGESKPSGGKKSVTFSDQVVLVSSQDQEVNQEEYDPMAYILQTLQARVSNMKIVVPPESEPSPSDSESEKLNGYDSDFEENSEESADNEEDQNNDKVRCNLCRKRKIEVNDVYCKDCTFYMARLQGPS